LFEDTSTVSDTYQIALSTGVGRRDRAQRTRTTGPASTLVPGSSASSGPAGEVELAFGSGMRSTERPRQPRLRALASRAAEGDRSVGRGGCAARRLEKSAS
jgi:hypothetical protein